MKNDPVSGPLTREELRELINAPHGKANALITKYEKGEKTKWLVTARAHSIRGTTIVEAITENEARAIAEELTGSDFNWDDPHDDFHVQFVEADNL